LFIRSIGTTASPLARAAVSGKTDALSSEETWQAVSNVFAEGAKISESASVKEQLTDWADLFFLFKPSFARAVGYVTNPTQENFEKFICCANDSAFDRMPQAFVGQNISSLKTQLAAIAGESVNGKVLTPEERQGFAAAIVKLNGDNFAKLLRLIARILGFFSQAVDEIRKLKWGILDGVLALLSSLLTAIAQALMQARDFILSLLNQAKDIDLPPPSKKETTKSTRDDGLLVRLLLGAGGGFVIGGPPGALIGAGVAAAATGK
jgi:hypothetical protein